MGSRDPFARLVAFLEQELGRSVYYYFLNPLQHVGLVCVPQRVLNC